MKRAFRLTALIAALLLVLGSSFGCGKKLPDEESHHSTINVFRPFYKAHSPREGEFGAPAYLTSADSAFSYGVFYPKSDLTFIDESISAFLSGQISSLTKSCREENQKGELSMDYSCIQAGEKLAGVYFYGKLYIDQSENSVNENLLLDLANKTVLEPSSVFSSEDKLRSHLTEEEFSLLTYEELLSRFICSDTGVIFFRRDHTELSLPYGQLKDAFSESFAALMGDYLSADPTDPTDPTDTGDPGETPSAGPHLIALTFDDGPSTLTDDFLEYLEEQGIRATFFVNGYQIERREQVLKDMAAAGHEIGCHTWKHEKLTTLTKEEIKANLKRTNDYIKDLTGRTVTLVRPPYGAVNDTVRQAVSELGLYLVNWSVDTEDWSNKNPDTMLEICKATTYDGCIVLMHDSYPTTLEGLKKIVSYYKGQGYEFVTVSELFEDSGVAMQAGMIHRSTKSIK